MKFTERALKALALARLEAGRLGCPFIGTEHLLLGVLREGEGLAVKIISFRADLRKVRQEIEERAERGSAAPGKEIPFTDRARRALEAASEEARGLGKDFVGTEHLLLGILSQAEGLGAQALAGAGVGRADEVRGEIRKLTQEGGAGQPAAEAAPAETPAMEIAPAELQEIVRSLSLPGTANLSRETGAVLKAAFEEAKAMGTSVVSPEHLFLALLKEAGPYLKEALAKRGLTPEDLRAALMEQL